MIAIEEQAYMELLRSKGMSYQQIADHTGHSKPAVYRALTKPTIGEHLIKLTTPQAIYLQMLVMEDKNTTFPKVRNEVLKVFRLA